MKRLTMKKKRQLCLLTLLCVCTHSQLFADDTQAEAVPIGLDEPSTGDFMSPQDGLDWFVFTTTEDGTLSYNWAVTGGNLEMSIYLKNG
ncbi:TPA: hypothetical protein EYO57_20400, partial [Candidatus Poribacteria bacterium]|nr:hypothetical protein [Candidatus Poribacteria bacterium]